MSHKFSEKTFGQLTYCDICKQLLWGLVKQGLQCKDCGYVCHKKCKASAAKCPSVIPTKFLYTNEDSKAEKYLRQLKQRAKSEDIIMTPSTSTSSVSTTDNNESFIRQLREILTSDKFQTLLADAATNGKIPINAYISNQAPLNAQITAKNFTRFVSRCGPVFEFKDQLLLLLCWNNRIDTLVAVIVYCIFCIYPKLALFIPQAILVYFILSNYPPKKKKPTTEKETAPAEEKSSKTAKVKTKLEEKKTAAIPDLSFPFNIAAILQPASDESPEYMKNLQNIQNTMGEFSDAYDWVMAQSAHFNWSSESETIRVLQIILVFSVLLAIAIIFVPLNMIFLMSGLIVFGVNTRFSKDMIKELKPYLVQSGKRQVEELKRWYEDQEDKLKNLDAVQEISVFENQRWWSKRGYLYEMVEGERSPWSDFTGRIYSPIITEVFPSKGYQWKETSEWKLDMTGPWVDNYLGIGIIYM